MQSYFRAIASCVGIYLVQFLTLPWLRPVYYPRSNEAYLLFAVVAAVGSLVATMVFRLRVWHFAAAAPVYFLLIELYAARGAYGVGMSGVSLDGYQARFIQSEVWIGAAICTCILFLIQLVCVLIAKLLRFIQMKRQS